MWQENSFGSGNGAIGGGSEGMMNVTASAYEYLAKKCSYLSNFSGYQDFVQRSTGCEKIWLGRMYLGCRGLRRFGPPYTSSQVTKLKKCQKCLGKSVNTMSGGSEEDAATAACCPRCFQLVHA